MRLSGVARVPLAVVVGLCAIGEARADHDGSGDNTLAVTAAVVGGGALAAADVAFLVVDVRAAALGNRVSKSVAIAETAVMAPQVILWTAAWRSMDVGGRFTRSYVDLGVSAFALGAVFSAALLTHGIVTLAMPEPKQPEPWAPVARSKPLRVVVAPAALPSGAGFCLTGLW